MIKINTEEFKNRINKAWGDNVCPMCGCDDWIASGDLYTPVMFNKDLEIQLGKAMLPLTPISCSNCGNTLFINTKILGCLDVQKDTKDEGKSE